MVESLIDKPKELLELIELCLKPKKVEKKKFGEVFTPMNLVNEMLDKLDECYIKEHKKSIFNESNFLVSIFIFFILNSLKLEGVSNELCLFRSTL